MSHEHEHRSRAWSVRQAAEVRGYFTMNESYVRPYSMYVKVSSGANDEPVR